MSANGVNYKQLKQAAIVYSTLFIACMGWPVFFVWMAQASFWMDFLTGVWAISLIAGFVIVFTRYDINDDNLLVADPNKPSRAVKCALLVFVLLALFTNYEGACEMDRRRMAREEAAESRKPMPIENPCSIP